MEPWASARKALSQCGEATSSFRVPRQLPFASNVMSVSFDNKGENEMMPGARSPSMKAVRPIIASNGVPCLQMTSVWLHSTLRREKKEKRESIGEILGTCFCKPSSKPVTSPVRNKARYVQIKNFYRDRQALIIVHMAPKTFCWILK